MFLPPTLTLWWVTDFSSLGWSLSVAAASAGFCAGLSSAWAAVLRAKGRARQKIAIRRCMGTPYVFLAGSDRRRSGAVLRTDKTLVRDRCSGPERGNFRVQGARASE